MQRITARIKSERVFLITSFVYASLVVVTFPFLRYFVDNPDSISHLSLARKYANGDFANAVNGYWSPLITWMLASVYIWIGNEILAFKVLQLLIGWFAIFNFVRIAEAFIHPRSLRFILPLTAVPFILVYGMLNLTADLLFLSVVLFYLRMVSEKEFFNHRHFGLIAGVLGALLYFSKSFGFIFFLVHFTILFFRNYMLTKEYPFKKHLRKNYFQALTCFILISSIWIYLLSEKYGAFTISENVYFNFSREVAAGPGEKNNLPILSGGIYRPANVTAVNAWEDPESSVKLTPLHPVSNSDDRSLYVHVLQRNFLSIYYYDFRNQPGWLFGLLLIIFLFSINRRKLISNDYFFSLALTLILVYLGYAMILVHARYIWICSFVILLLTAWMMEDILSGNRYHRILITAAGLLLMAWAAKRPVKEILFSEDRSVKLSTLTNALLHPLKAMTHTYHTDQVFDQELKKAKEIIKEGENLAFIENSETRDSYTRASLLAFVSGARNYGQPQGTLQESLVQLERAGVQHLVLFSDTAIVTVENGWQVSYRNEEVPLIVVSRTNR